MEPTKNISPNARVQTTYEKQYTYEQMLHVKMQINTSIYTNAASDAEICLIPTKF